MRYISTIKKNNQDRVEFYKTEVPQMNESQTLTEATGTYQSKLAKAVQEVVQECIDYGSGNLTRDDMILSANWAENQDDIEILLKSEGRTLYYNELGVATELGY